MHHDSVKIFTVCQMESRANISAGAPQCITSVVVTHASPDTVGTLKSSERVFLPKTCWFDLTRLLCLYNITHRFLSLKAVIGQGWKIELHCTMVAGLWLPSHLLGAGTINGLVFCTYSHYSLRIHLSCVDRRGWPHMPWFSEILPLLDGTSGNSELRGTIRSTGHIAASLSSETQALGQPLGGTRS